MLQEGYMTVTKISIHAPREGSDPRIVCTGPGRPTFQSTLPVRGATLGGEDPSCPGDISIHAPREGSDEAGPKFCHFPRDFNPRSP